MKTTTIPPLRVSPELRQEAEAVLREGETLSGFMLESLQDSIARRRDQQEFIARGLKSAAKARRTGQYVTDDEVVKQLSIRLQKARAKSAAGSRG
ncbi:MAG: prevent-host-death protein [Gammaproteobacteria bacterium PRO9]|nr:prevent-host-death protein [Gammaproteobacteria bacterium PRO9]